MRVSTPLGQDELLLVGFAGCEEISSLFSFRLDLLATNATPVDFDKLLGQPMLVAIQIMDQNPGGGASTFRYIGGICSRFVQGHRDNDFTEYEAEIVPHLWLLTRRAQSRIFQHMSVPDILKKVLQGIKVTFELDGQFEERDYCVQYRETDFNFVSRLMEEEGIFYYFKHTESGHEMIVGNSLRVHQAVPGPHGATWQNVDSADRDGNHIHEWKKQQGIRSGKVTLWDHTFEHPDDNLEATKSTLDSIRVGTVAQKLAVADNEQLEIYDYPGEYAKRFDGADKGGTPTPAEIQKIFEDNRRTVGIRIQAETVAGLTIHGTSNCRHFTAGHHFKLERHFNGEGKYLLTSVSHMASLGNAYRSGGEETFSYTNSFACIPHELPFRPQRRTPKPEITGVQTATVVGPKGQEIFVDKHARVKVQFPWDREGKHDADSSCWIRVSQAWGGGSFGGMAIPRIGHEVIVGFVEGDPDRPIITGRVYNAKNMPHPSNAGRKTAAPPSMKEAAMMTSFKSQSTPGGGGHNEITMNDTKGKEGLYIRAQYDEIHEVLHDRTDTVENDETRKVLANRSRSVGKNESVSVALTRTHTVGVNEAIAIGAAQEIVIGAAQALTVAADRVTGIGLSDLLTVGKKLAINVGDEISIVTGDASITMKKNGDIHISGKNITISGTAETAIGVGNQNVKCDQQQVATSGAAINSSATGKHEITGAVVKIN